MHRVSLPLAVLMLMVACDGPSSSPSSTAVDANLALEASLTSSDPGAGGGLRNLVDGDVSTGWTGPAGPYWFELDLGAQVEVGAVRLLAGADSDAVVYVNVGVHDNPGRRPGEHRDGLQGGGWLETPVGYESRFVRVTVERASPHITWLEVEVVAG